MLFSIFYGFLPRVRNSWIHKAGENFGHSQTRTDERTLPPGRCDGGQGQLAVTLWLLRKGQRHTVMAVSWEVSGGLRRMTIMERTATGIGGTAVAADVLHWNMSVLTISPGGKVCHFKHWEM